MPKFDISPRFVTFGGTPNELPFTRYFLNQWLDTNLLEPPEDFEDGIKEIFSKEIYGSEADTETKIIRPVFKKLGFKALTEKKDIENIGQPDQVYYDTDDNAKKRKLSGILVIVEAKAWDESLRAAQEKQIREYIDLANSRSNQKIKWGILTNGKLWRLYKAGRRGYIEFNLEKLAGSPVQLDLARESNNNKSFHLMLFYTLFRKEAFENSGKFLNSIVAQSEQHQREIETELHRQAYPALLAIFNGYWEIIKDKIPENQKEEKIKEVYEDSLYYLYRLLFVLFSKGRELNFYKNLPTSNKNLLDRLTKDAPIQYNNQNGEIIFGVHVEEAKQEIFSRYSFTNVSGKLLEIFMWLDKGNKYRNIPQYNGNLFSERPIDHLWIRDYYISMALRLLEYGPGGASLDYSSLDIRHLGNIYERLLLFDVPKQGKNYDFYYEGIVGKGKKVKLTFPQKWFYFDIDPSERKSTGTYYTPDYIVKYIVENTVGKKLHEIMKSEKDNKLRQILSLKVLDPAMGSGHFLVRVVDEISSFIIENLGNVELEEPRMNIISKKEQAAKGFGDITNLVRELIGEWEKFDDVKEKLTSEIFWQRIVAKRCIYGVDLKPFAVELAKLALWLHTLSEDEPLQFLDHHLRCGNSLVGVWDVSDIVSEDAEKFKEFIKPIKDILAISQSRDSSIEEVRRSQELYEHVHESLEKFITRLDVALAARHFMEFKDAKNKDAIVNQIEQAVEKGEAHPRLAEAKEIAKDKRFFHWKIEFPEIWYSDKFKDGAEEKENAGFDVVVGNPPYVLLQMVEDSLLEFEFIKNNYQTASYKIDLYHIFLEIAIKLIRKQGYFSFITPNTFFKNKFLIKLRKMIYRNTYIRHIVNFYDRVFSAASVDTAIMVCQKEKIDKGKINKILVSKIDNVDFFEDEVKKYDFYFQKNIIKDNYLFNFDISNLARAIIEKLHDNSKKFSEIGSAYFGIQTYNRKKYVSANKVDENFKLVIDGGNIHRYHLIKPAEYVNFIDEAIKSGGNPEIYQKNRVVVRQIGMYPQGAFCPKGIYTLNTVYNLYLNDEDFDLKYILSIINSKLIQFFWINMFYDKKMTFPKIKKNPLESIPIKDINLNSQAPFIAKADIMLTQNKQLQEQSDEFLDWLQAEYKIKKLSNKLTTFYELDEDTFIKEVKRKSSKKRISPKHRKELINYFHQYQDKIKPILKKINETDKKIDQMVYELYGLTDEEIKIVEGS